MNLLEVFSDYIVIFLATLTMLVILEVVLLFGIHLIVRGAINQVFKERRKEQAVEPAKEPSHEKRVAPLPVVEEEQEQRESPPVTRVIESRPPPIVEPSVEPSEPEPDLIQAYNKALEGSETEKQEFISKWNAKYVSCSSGRRNQPAWKSSPLVCQESDLGVLILVPKDKNTSYILPSPYRKHLIQKDAEKEIQETFGDVPPASLGDPFLLNEPAECKYISPRHWQVTKRGKLG